MGWTIEDEIEIEPFAMAESKDNDPCHLVRDEGIPSNSTSLCRLPGAHPIIDPFISHLSPKDLITFASN